MSTTTDETTDRHDLRFEDRLLHALLAEFDAPAEVRASPGPTPAPRRARQRAGTWLAAAAVVTLLGGSTWVFTGGLDPDDTRVTVAGAPTTVVAPGYLAFPESQGDPDATVFHTSAWTADYGDPERVLAWFRPTDGGRERPLVAVTYDPSLWDAGSGAAVTTPDGIELHSSPPWSDPAGPTTYGTWQDADGRVFTVQQATSSYSSRQQLELLSSEQVEALVDAVRFDGTRIELDDPSYDQVDDDPNAYELGTASAGTDGAGSDAEGFTTSAAGMFGTSETDPTASISPMLLDRAPGAVDLDRVAGEPVSVRGVPGVYGHSSTPIDNASAIVWTEDGATYTLSAGAPGQVQRSRDELLAAAATLETVTKAEYDSRAGGPVSASTRGGVRLYLPSSGVDNGLKSLSLGADGTPLVGDSPGSDAGYGVGRSRYVDLMVSPDAATILVWQGPSQTAPACAQRIDVSKLTPTTPMRVDFDTTCTG